MFIFYLFADNIFKGWKSTDKEKQELSSQKADSVIKKLNEDQQKPEQKDEDSDLPQTKFGNITKNILFRNYSIHYLCYILLVWLVKINYQLFYLS